MNSMSYRPDFIVSQSPSCLALSKASKWAYLHLSMWQSPTVGGLFSKSNATTTNIRLNWKLVIIVDNCTAAQCNFIILGYYNWLQDTTFCTALAMSLASLRSTRARRQIHTWGHAHRVIWDPYEIAGASRSETLILNGSCTWKRVMAIVFRLHRGLTSIMLAKISIPSVRTVFINGFKILYVIYHDDIPIYVSTVRPISSHSKLSSWNQRSDSCFTFVALIDSLGGVCGDPGCRRCWWPR